MKECDCEKLKSKLAESLRIIAVKELVIDNLKRRIEYANLLLNGSWRPKEWGLSPKNSWMEK